MVPNEFLPMTTVFFTLTPMSPRLNECVGGIDLVHRAAHLNCVGLWKLHKPTRVASAYYSVAETLEIRRNTSTGKLGCPVSRQWVAFQAIAVIAPKLL